MEEDFLHTVWQHRWMEDAALETITGESISVLSVGKHNHSSGPDFLEARVKIGAELWVGSVEIHWRSSDWHRHAHTHDRAYDNVILHVVYQHDQDIFLNGRYPIPTLELEGRIQKRLYQRYQNLHKSTRRLPCTDFLPNVDRLVIGNWLDRVLVERWQIKATMIDEMLEKRRGDWVEVCYQLIARYLGGQYNKEPMAELAECLPLRFLQRFEDIADQEALVLGCGGFFAQRSIETMVDSYVKDRADRFNYLKRAHQLEPISQRWMTGKIRPMAHPTRRLMQLVNLLGQIDILFNEILQGQLPNWSGVQSVNHPFWERHYNLETSSNRKLSISISKELGEILNINVVVPIMFAYAEASGDQTLKQQAIKALDDIPSEKNNIIRFYRSHGLESRNAAQSQALVQLKNHYCNPKKCVICTIGRAIIAKI